MQMTSYLEELDRETEEPEGLCLRRPRGGDPTPGRLLGDLDRRHGSFHSSGRLMTRTASFFRLGSTGLLRGAERGSESALHPSLPSLHPPLHPSLHYPVWWMIAHGAFLQVEPRGQSCSWTRCPPAPGGGLRASGWCGRGLRTQGHTQHHPTVGAAPLSISNRHQPHQEMRISAGMRANTAH